MTIINSESGFVICTGRFQPFHKGHQDLINYAKSLGKIPIIIIGGNNGDEQKNPLTKEQRKTLIQLENPDILDEQILFNYGSPKTKEGAQQWADEILDLLEKIGATPEATTILYSRKSEDLRDLVYNGKNYHNVHCVDLLTKPIGKMIAHNMPFQEEHRDYSATRIRQQPEFYIDNIPEMARGAYQNILEYSQTHGVPLSAVPMDVMLRGDLEISVSVSNRIPTVSNVDSLLPVTKVLEQAGHINS